MEYFVFALILCLDFMYVWQKPPQYFKVISLQLKLTFFFKESVWWSQGWEAAPWRIFQGSSV